MEIDWSAISAGTQVIGQAISIAKSLKDATSGTKEGPVVNELLQKLLEAHVANLSLVDLARQAKEKVVELERSIDERQRYALAEVVPGKFAFRFKKTESDEEPAHYLCQACFDTGQRSVLQTFVKASGTYLRCVVVATHEIRIGDASARLPGLIASRLA